MKLNFTCVALQLFKVVSKINPTETISSNAGYILLVDFMVVSLRNLLVFLHLIIKFDIMKSIRFIAMAVAAMVIISCNKSDDNAQNNDTLNEVWHLVNVSGGFAGVNDSFERNIITWEFNSENGSLFVMNNNTDTSKQSGLTSGNYVFAVEEINGSLYFILNEQESGEVTIVENNLLIDENSMSNGSGADRFKYMFER